MDWKPWAARRVAHAHPRAQDKPLLKAVGDPAAVMGGDLTRLPSLGCLRAKGYGAGSGEPLRR